MIDPLLIGGYLALGAFGGLMAGLLGIGGGMILVPFLAMMFTAQGHPYATLMQVCLATSTAIILFTSISSARAHHRVGNVRWDLVRKFVPGILLGCLAGATILSQMPTKPVKIFFACFMFYSAAKMLLHTTGATAKPAPTSKDLFWFGIFVGGISAMVGAGGGFLTIPYMNARGVDPRKSIGTSSALGLPIAIFATIGYIVNGWSVPHLPSPHLGYVFLPALLGIAVASMLFAPLGAKLTQKLPVATLRKIFAFVLFALALRMVWMAIE